VFALTIGTIVAYAGVLILGVPAYYLLRSRGWTAFWIAPLLGLLIGGIMWLAFSAMFALSLDEGIWGVRLALTDFGTLRGVIWPGGVIGAAVGTTLWFIARPDQRTS
jgi:hypothetical protein